MKIFSLQKNFLLLVLCLAMGTTLYAQPANDDCLSATVLTVAADEMSAVQEAGDTRGTVDATTVAGPLVCSGSWYTDDVWYSFTVGATVPTNGITVRTYYTGTGTDLPNVGMAIYTNDCSPANDAIDCFSDEPGRTDLLLYPQCITAGDTYLVRIWSAGDPIENAGTFSIAAFEAEPPAPSTDNVIWSEDFNGGIGNWTTNAGPNTTDSTDVWLWDATGTFFNAFGGSVTINSPTSSCTGAMGFPSGWFQTNRTGDVSEIPPGPPYPTRSAQLVSPPIDCSNVTAAAVKFTSSFRGLNGSTNSSLGAIFDYSVDGGQTWSFLEDPSAEWVQNEAITTESRFTLSGAGGQSDVRIRFTFEGDFYYWIIDDIRVIEPEANNMRVNAFYSIPNAAQVPSSQVEAIPFRALADVQNIGGAAQTNVNLNLSIADDSGAVVYTEDLAYNTVGADSLAQNVPFANAYTLPADAGAYTGTYTVSADDADFDEGDNTREFTFTVTDSVYARETGRTRALAPGGGNWDDGAPHSWGFGNYFRIKKGTNGTGTDSYVCTSVSFGITNPDELPGLSVSAWLYKWDNANGDDIVQESERTRVGFNVYEIQGTEPANAEITIPLQDFVSGDWFVALEDDTDYIVMIEYVAPDDVLDLFIEASTDYDYGDIYE